MFQTKDRHNSFHFLKILITQVSLGFFWFMIFNTNHKFHHSNSALPLPSLIPLSIGGCRLVYFPSIFSHLLCPIWYKVLFSICQRACLLHQPLGRLRAGTLSHSSVYPQGPTGWRAHRKHTVNAFEWIYCLKFYKFQNFDVALRSRTRRRGNWDPEKLGDSVGRLQIESLRPKLASIWER